MKITLRVKAHHAVLVIVTSLLLVFVWRMTSDTCEGQAYTRVLCALYEEGVIDGDLCPRLCVQKDLYISGCDRNDGSVYRVFIYQDFVFRIENSRFTSTGPGELRDFGLLSKFNGPNDGVTEDAFRDMVLQYLEEKLGDHQGLKKVAGDIVSLADADSNYQLSAGEARSVWALLQRHDFLLLFLLRDTGYVPRLKGYCGDVFAQEISSSVPFYDESYKESLISSLLPNYYLFGIPSWKNRAQITLALLEFVEEIYELDSGVSLYYCDFKPENIGYSKDYSFKPSSLMRMVSEKELAEYFKEKQCHTHSDCVYSQSCRSKCDFTTHSCSTTVHQPNLVHSCQILRTYLTPSIPHHVVEELNSLFGRCLSVTTDNPNFILDHALILQELKSLLWQEIA